VDSSADRQAAIDQISDALGQAVGADVTVRWVGGRFRASLSFESLDEALELASRLSAGRSQ